MNVKGWTRYLHAGKKKNEQSQIQLVFSQLSAPNEPLNAEKHQSYVRVLITTYQL